jgi:hypothetical protein
MSFVWESKRTECGMITLYKNNITLNKDASAYFQDVYGVMIGIDYENRKLAIRPVDRNTYSKGLVPKDQFFNISINKTYSRITNKEILEKLSSSFDLDFEKNNFYKYPTTWSAKNNLLIADLEGGE